MKNKTRILNALTEFTHAVNGGAGSGNWSHRGRKGLVGGSAPKSAGTSSHLSSSKREAIKNMTDEEFDKEMSDFTNKRFSDFNRRKQAILGGKSDSIVDVVESISSGGQLELASPEQLTKLRDFENKFNQETKEITAEYYKARYNGLDEGYYRDSSGNVGYVSGDYDYPDGFAEYGRKQMFYQVGSSQNRDSVEYIMSDNEKRNYKKVSRNEALASLKDGETLGGISQSEQRIIDAYIHSPLLSYALRNGENVRSVQELQEMDLYAEPGRYDVDGKQWVVENPLELNDDGDDEILQYAFNKEGDKKTVVELGLTDKASRDEHYTESYAEHPKYDLEEFRKKNKTDSSISDEALNKIRDFTDDSYARSEALRKGNVSEDDRIIDSVFEASENGSETVYRGLQGDYAKQIANLNVGDTFTDPSYVYTTRDLNIANYFSKDASGERGAVLVINLPDGKGISCLRSVLFNRTNERFFGQKP